VLFELIKGLMKDLDGTAVDEVHIIFFFYQHFHLIR
jgi:hypothetical protein